LIVGNWKMNGVSASLAEIALIASSLADAPAQADVVICPPSTLVAAATAIVDRSPVSIGAQDCHSELAGAFTGDVSAEMLADAGARLVILGHSERRAHHGETDEAVAAKARAAVRAGLAPIVCVGETAQQRQAGETLAVIEAQLLRSAPDLLSRSSFAVAYEPRWAIGAGRTPALEEIAEVHGFIRSGLIARFGEAGRVADILYGGSAAAGNARQILGAGEVGGLLVGGASLTAGDFLKVLRAM
jgi:triosephosphate isomerase